MIIKRLISFQDVRAGLRAYFDERYGTYYEIIRKQIINDDLAGILSKNTGISFERIETLFELAYNVSDSDVNELDFPTSTEFDKMMFVDFCDKKDAIFFQKRLDDEFKIFMKQKQET